MSMPEMVEYGGGTVIDLETRLPHQQPAPAAAPAPAIDLSKPTAPAPPVAPPVPPAFRPPTTPAPAPAVSAPRTGWLRQVGADVVTGLTTLPRMVWGYEQACEYTPQIRAARAAAEAGDGDPAAVERLIEARRAVRRNRHREPATVAGTTTGTSYVAAVVAIAQAWGLLAAAPALLPVLLTLAVVGRSARTQAPKTIKGEIVENTTTTVEIERLPGGPVPVQGGADLIDALVRASIITEAQRAETSLAGPIVPVGPGWQAVIELPRGVVAEAAIGKLPLLASALRIKKQRIEMRADTGDEGHDGRLVLWVANSDSPYGKGKTDSELIKAASWDYWAAGVPLGVDARGARHVLHLMWSSILIGGLMGYGKSYLARLIAAAAALDPTVRIVVITGKTGPDWAPLRHVADTWIAGSDPSTIRAALRTMDGLMADLQARGTELDRIYEADPTAVPEGKITPQLARNRGMGPVLLVVDELQELLDGAALVQVAADAEDDGEDGREKKRSARTVMVESFARFVRVTRFVGGQGVFITQRPSADSVPTMLRDVCGHRASFRVKNPTSSKMVLGDDAVTAGAAPHLLTDDSKGVVVLDAGAEDGHITLKSDLIDLPQFREICERGRQLREQAGTLSGAAATYGRKAAEAAAHRQLLTDCLTVLEQAGLDRARTERLVELLAAAHPDRYPDLTGPDLQARLRDAGAGGTRKIGAVDGAKNANGYTADQIRAARDE